MPTPKTLLRNAFDQMLHHFGPRGWWPGEMPFEVMVGAILTQNTNWGNVERAIANLKAEDVLTPERLFSLPPSTLERLITPAGFFRVKAGRLRSFLRFFLERYDGNACTLMQRELPDLREELLTVSGIGPETADSILLYALRKPIFVIDAYTKRILSRHGLCAEDDGYDELQSLFMDHLPQEIPLFNEYHALIVETAKQFCRTKPRCEACPLNGWNERP